VQDVYAELLVPVLKDLPLLQNVELELGFRHSTYEHTDSTDTFKALANIQVNDALRFRGGFNRANRAPNLGELFLELQQIFTGGFGITTDPCGLRSNATFGAGGAAPDAFPNGSPGEPTIVVPGGSMERATSTYLICQAQMGTTGVSEFYGINVPNGGLPTANFGAANFIGAPGTDFNNGWVQQVGNSNLKSEKANTWSVGFVFAGAGMSANPWLRGFTGSVDWWKVGIKDAIQPYSPDYAGWLCYGQDIVTTLAAAQAYISGPGATDCGRVPREPTRGTALSKRVAFDNQATISTAGIDVAVNWSAQLDEIGLGVPGRLGFNTQATFLDYYRTQASPIEIDIPIDWKGSLGPNLTGTNPGAYSYRINTNFNYGINKLNVNLGWRYLPSVWTINKAYEYAIVANNERVTAGGAGILMPYTKLDEIKTKAYSEFSLSASYQLTDSLVVRAGVNNLFDKAPPNIGGTTGVTQAQLATWCDGAPGCNAGVQRLPRTSFAGGAGNPAGTKGYYDVMGRSFFLGFKASF
jgi:iron complex outermembrane recepter protein